MAGGSKKRQQGLALAALLKGLSQKAAARKAGVSERTVRVWLADPAFRAEYEARQRAGLERAVAGLGGLAPRAFRTLGKNMKCGQPAAENRAAELALAFMFKGLELVHLAGEVARLREQVEG